MRLRGDGQGPLVPGLRRMVIVVGVALLVEVVLLAVGIGLTDSSPRAGDALVLVAAAVPAAAIALYALGLVVMLVLAVTGERARRRGRHETAVRRLGGAATVDRVLGTAQSGAFLNNRAIALRRLGRLDDAAASYAAAVAAQRHQRRRRWSLAMSLASMSGVLLDLGKVDEARASAREAVDLLAPVSHRLAPEWRGVALLNLGLCELHAGDLDAARRALEECRDHGDLTRLHASGRPLVALAEIARRSGDVDAARRDVDAGLALATPVDDLPGIAYAYEVAGDVALDGGDIATARTAFADAHRAAEADADDDRCARLEMALALCDMREGHRDEARARVDAATPRAVTALSRRRLDAVRAALG